MLELLFKAEETPNIFPDIKFDDLPLTVLKSVKSLCLALLRVESANPD